LELQRIGVLKRHLLVSLPRSWSWGLFYWVASHGDVGARRDREERLHEALLQQ